MPLKFDKDRWIRIALTSGYLIANQDGSIYRRTHSSVADGKVIVSGEALLVKFQIHKKSGRVYFNMSFLGKTKSVLVNRVIAWAFLPNPSELPQVNHIDGDKENNALYNLEWATGRDNERHAHRTGLKTGRGSNNSNAKLNAAKVIAIRSSELGATDLAKSYGVSRATIMNVITRKTWVHI